MQKLTEQHCKVCIRVSKKLVKTEENYDEMIDKLTYYNDQGLLDKYYTEEIHNMSVDHANKVASREVGFNVGMGALVFTTLGVGKWAKSAKLKKGWKSRI